MNRLGDTLEGAIWYNADQPGERDKAKEGLYKALAITEEKQSLQLGPVSFEDLAPGDERVPEPNPDFAGTPRLMVGFALVVKLLTKTIGADVGFSQDLAPDDLDKLRKVTQRGYLMHNPGAVPLTNEQLDKYIDETGPETAARQIH